MISTLGQRLKNSDFLRSSSILFGVNLLNGVLNFGILFLVNFRLEGSYSQWLALTSLLNILAAPSAGFSTHIVKRFGLLDHNNPEEILPYYRWLQNIGRKISLYSLPLVPAIFGVLWLVTDSGMLREQILLLLYVILQLYLIINQQLLLGTRCTEKYALVAVLLAGSRLALTMMMLYLNLGLLSMPLGYLAAGLLAFALGEWLVGQVLRTKAGDPKQASDNQPGFDLKKELSNMVLTGVSLQILALFLSLNPIVSEGLLTVEERYTYAVAFTFGQMIHFASIAGLGAFVAHSARKKDLNLYKYTVLGVGLLGIMATVGICLVLFLGSPIWASVGKPEYSSTLGITALVGLFTMGYNIIYVSMQFLLSHSEYRKALELAGVVAVLILGYAAIWLWIAPGSRLLPFLILNLGCTMVGSVYLYFRIVGGFSLPNSKKPNSSLTHV